MALREALSSDAPVFSALKVLNGFNREAVLAEYERLFGVSFVADAEQLNVQRMTVDDPELSAQDGVYRQRELSNAYDILVLAAQGTDPGSDLFQQALEEYAFVRLELLSRREGELSVGAVDRLDISRGSSFVVDTNLVERARAERQAFEATLDEYFGNNSEVRAFQRQYVRQATSEAAAAQFTQNVQILRYQETLAQGLARDSEHRDRTRGALREREILTRYLEQVDPNGVLQNSSSFQSLIQGGPQGGKSYLQQLDDQASADLKAALKTAQELNDAMSGWGTYDKRLQKALRDIDPRIRHLTIQVYEIRFGVNLMDRLHDDLSGNNAQEAFARYAGDNLFADQVVLFAASEGWGSSESRIREALEHSVSLIDTQVRQELTNEGLELQERASRLRSLGGNDQEASTLLLEAQSLLRAAKLTDPDNERYERKFREKQIAYSHSFDVAYRDRGMTFDSELMTEDELDNPELARAIWNQPLDPDARLMLEFRSTLDGDVNGAGRALEGEVDKVLEKFLVLSIQRESDGKIIYTELDQNGREVLLPEFRPENLQMFARWAAVEAASGRLDPSFARFIAQAQSVEEIFEDEFGVPREAVLSTYEQFYASQVLQPRYLPLIADGSILSPEKEFHFTENSEGKLLLAGEAFSAANQLLFRRWAHDTLSPELRAQVESHNGPLQELLVQGNTRNEALIQAYEQFYHNEILDLDDIRAAFEERIDELDEAFRTSKGKDESLRDYVYRESVNAGPQSIGWLTALLDGDLVEAQAHAIKRSIAGAGTYDKLLNHSIQPHEHVLTRMRALEQQMWEMQTEYGEAVQGNAGYLALQQELELYASRVRTRFDGVEAVYSANYGDIWDQVRGDIGRERYVILRSVAEEGTLSRAAQVRLALKGSWDGTELEDLKSTLSGLTKEELDQLAIDLYVLDHEIGRSRRDTVDKDEAIEYLRDQLNSETSGDDWYEVRILLVGEPRTVEQMWELMELHQKHVRGALGSGLTDIFGDADDRFDDVYGEFRALYFSEYLSDNSEQKARAERRLRALFANATVSAQAALEQRNSVADTIIDTGTTVIVVGGAVAAGFFSFGAGTVAILTAAAAVGRIAGGATLKGGSYGSGQFATDLGMTAVDFATMGAGKYISMGARRVGGSIAARLAARGIQNPAALRAAARIAAEASEEVTERAGVAVATAIEEGAEQAAKKVAVETVKQVGEQTVVKQLSKQAVREFLMKGPIGGEAAWQWGAKIIDSRFITRVAMNATEGALDGAVTGFALGAGQVGIREETWEHGFGNGLHMMLSAGGQNALIGGAFGAKFGAAMGAISSPKYLYSRNDPNSLISQLESGHAPKQRTLTVERRVGEVTDRVASARDRAQVAKEALEEIRLGNRDATRAEIRDLKVKAKESHFVSSGETSANIEADMRFRGYDDAQAIVARDALTTFDAEVRISKLERGHRLKLAFGELAQPNTSVGKRFSDFREALGEWWGARGQIRANRAQRYVKYQEAIVTQGTSKRLSGLETVTPSLRAEARSAELAKFKSRESLIPLRGGKSLPNFKEAVLQFREFQKAADTFFHSYGKKRIQENSNALRKIALEQEATALKNNKHEQVSETVVSLREGSLNAQVKYENLALQRAEAWAKLKRGQLPGWDLVSLDLGSQVRQARRAAVRRHHAFQVGLDLPRRVEARLSIVDNSPAVIERAIDVETLSLQRDLNKVQRRQNRLRIVTDFAQGRFKSSADNFRSARSLSESLQASGERVRGLRRQTDLDILEHYAHGILPDNPDLAAKWALETAKMNSHLAAYHHAADHHPLARLNLKEAAKAIPAYFERRPTDRLFRAAEFEVNIGKMRTAEYKSRFDAYMSKIPAEQSAVASRLANADIDVKSSFQRMKNAYVEQMDALASGDGKRVRELSETIRKQRREYFAARKRRSDARASFQIEVQTIEIQAKRPDISIAAARREAEAVVLFKRSLNPLSDENPLETLERKLARQRRNRGLQLEQERLVSYAERIDPNNQADVKLANQRAAAERTFQQRKREFHAIRDRYESALHMGGNGDDFRVIEARYERKLREFQRASSERKAVRERFRIRQREFSIAQETDRMVQEGIARNRASRIAAANYDSRVALRQGKLLTAYREHNMAVYLEKPEVRFAKFERKFQAGVTALGEGESALTLAHTRADAWRKLNQARYELRVRERHVFDQLATGNGGDLDFAALEARQAQLREELDVAKKTYKTVNAEYKKQVRERKAAERAIRDAEAHFGIDGDIAQARTIKQERFDALTQAEGEYNFLKTEKRRNRIGEVIDFVTRDGEGLKQRRLRQQQLEQELATATTDLRRARERAHLDHEKSLIDKSSYSNRETQKDVREALLQNSRAKASLDEASKRPVTGIFERRAARKEIRKANMVLASLQEEASFATRRDQHLRELLTSPDRGARSYRRPAEVRAAAEGFAGALTRSEDLGNRLKRELGAIRRGQIDSLSDLASTSVELAKAKVAERRASRKFRQEVQIEHFAESAHQQLGGSTETLEVAREYAAARAKRNRLSSRADRLLENATGLVQGRRRVTSPSEAMEIELQFREARARFREAQRIEQFGSTTGVSEAAGKVRAAELEQLAAKREGRVIDTSSVKKARREMRSRERVARHDIKMVANAEDHGFAIQDYTIVDSGRAQRVTAHVDQSRPRAKISSAGPRPERNLIDEVVTLREQLDSLHSRLQQAKSLPEKRALEIDIRNTREQIAHLSGDGGMIPDEFGFTSRDYETLLGDMRVQVEQQHNSFAASEDGLTGARESEILENLGGEGAVTEDRAVQDLYRRQSELIQEQRVATKTRQDAIDIELERIADQIALKESGANVIHETSSGVHRSSGNSGGESGDSFGGSDSDWGTPKGGDGNTGGGTGGKGAVAEDGASSQNRQGDDSPEWMGEGYEEVLADIRNQDRQFEQGDYDFLRDTDGGEDFGGSGGGSRGSDRGPHGPSRQSGGGLSTQEREARTVLKMTPDGETAGPGFGPRNKGPAGAVDAIDEVSTFEPQLQLEPEKVDVAVAVLEKPITATETPTSRLEVDLQPGRHVGPGAPVELDFTLHKTPEIGVHISPDRQLERAVEVDPRTTTRSSTRGENQFRLHATPVLAEQQMALLADIQWKVHAQPESTIQPKVQDEPNRKGRKLRLGGDDDYGRGRIGEYPMWDVTLSVFKKSDTWDPRHLPSFQSIDPKDRRRIFEMLKDFWGEREIIRYTEWV
ncbi:MAG: hypothetical protein KDD64_10140 [Bdellovibrionales bacterium]|nr:hypothetical protein [Bdellovibrionales bacterium]